MAHKYFKNPTITIEHQTFSMKKYFPAFSLERGRNVARWIGDLQPTGISKTYTIKIIYEHKKWPKVWVINPKLLKRPDEDRIPHTYTGDRLCLFFPSANEWTAGMPIYKSIIPWTSLWLYYYEVWYATGLWQGKGHHPVRNKKG